MGIKCSKKGDVLTEEEVEVEKELMEYVAEMVEELKDQLTDVLEEKEEIRVEIAAVESEMRAIDGIGFFNWRPDYQKKAELAMQKKELEEELENNSRLEIVLGIVTASADLYVALKKAELKGWGMRAMGTRGDNVLERLEQYGLPDLVEQVVESDDILELYDKAREFSELIDEAQADFLHQEMDIGLMNKHKRKRMEKNHKRMLRRREKKETTRKGGEKRTKIRRDRASFRSLNVGNFG